MGRLPHALFRFFGGIAISVDVSPVTANIVFGALAGAFIGISWLAMVAGVALYRWVLSAM